MIASPTEVVAAAFAALESGDWSTVAELTHPSAITEFRSHQISHLLAWAEFYAKDEATRGSGFGSSGEINAELLARFTERTLDWLPDRPTIGALAAAAPKEFFARWLGAGYTESPRPRQGQRIPRQVLGVVQESERLAHVVYRGMGWIPIVEIQVMSVSREGDRWLLMQNMDILRSPRLLKPGAPC